MRSNSRLVQAEFCRQGSGFAVLPRPLGDRISGIVPIDMGEAPPGRDTYIGYHRDLRGLSRLRTLLDLVIERFAT
jgi:DNA-binding transcriptional LysR family regulator